MKTKKLICAFLCIVMLFALAIPAFAAKPTTANFEDTKGHWAEHQIALVADAGIVGGYSPTEFRPNANITREAFAKVVSNFMGFTEEADLSQYKDVDPDGNLSVYVARCVAAKVMGGFSATRMAPKNFITREQAAAMLCRAFKLDTSNAKGNFVDKDKIAAVLQPEVAALELTGLITGYNDGTFRPKDNLTRGQMMVIISRLLPDNDGYFFRMDASSGELKMTLDVLNDYTTVAYIPAGNVSAEKIAFNAKIDSIPGLGIDISSLGPTQISDTIDTGFKETFNPEELFSEAYDFHFATLKGSVNNKTCTYNIYGKNQDGGTTLTMSPTKSDDSDAALKELVNLQTIFVNIFLHGNSITLAKDSYMQIGTEKICFDDNYNKDLVMNLNASGDEITAEVFKALEIRTGVASDGNQATFVIKKGTCATTEAGTFKLMKDITITLNGVDKNVDGIITQIEDMVNASNADMIIAIANELIGAIDGHVVYLNVTTK